MYVVLCASLEFAAFDPPAKRTKDDEFNPFNWRHVQGGYNVAKKPTVFFGEYTAEKVAKILRYHWKMDHVVVKLSRFGWDGFSTID